MKKFALIPIMLLGACQQNSLSKIMYPETTDLRYADSAYCYKSLTDIVCYKTAQPQLSNPIKGVQLPSDSQMVDSRDTMMEQWAQRVYYNMYKRDPRKAPQAIPERHIAQQQEVLIQEPEAIIVAPAESVTVRTLPPVANSDAPQPLIMSPQ